MCCSHCSTVSACGTNRAQFSFFSNRQSVVNDGFEYSHTLCYHPTISTAVVLQNSCHPSNVFVNFRCSWPGLLLHSTSLIDPSPAANHLCHRNTVANDMDESPNAFTNIFHIFAAVNPALQQNFIAALVQNYFPW